MNSQRLFSFEQNMHLFISMKGILSIGPNMIQNEIEIGLNEVCKVTGLNGRRHCQ